MENMSKDTDNSAGNNNLTNMMEVASSPNYVLHNTNENLADSASINVDEWLKPKNELVANIDVNGVIKTEGMESSYLDALGYRFLSPKDSVDMCIVANICDMGLGLDGNTCDKSKLSTLLSLNDKESSVRGSSDSEEQNSFLEDLDVSDISDKEILVAVESSEVGDSDKFNLIRYCNNSVSVNYILEPDNEESFLPDENSISSELREDGSYCEDDEIVCKKPLESLTESKEKISCESYIISRQSGTYDAEKDVDFSELNFLTFQVDPNDGMNAMSQMEYCDNESSVSCNIAETPLLPESDSISDCALMPETRKIDKVPLVSGPCNLSDTTFSHKLYCMPEASVISNQYCSSETSLKQEECPPESALKQTPCMSSDSSFVAEECNLSQALVTDECNLPQTLIMDECSSSETPLITEQCNSPTPLIDHCSLPEDSVIRQSSSSDVPLLSGPSLSEISQLSDRPSSEETQLLPVHCSSSDVVCVQEESGISDIVHISEPCDSSEVLSLSEQCSTSDVSVLSEECNSLNVPLISSQCSSSDVPLSLKSIVVSESPIITPESCATTGGAGLTEQSSSTDMFKIPTGSRIFIAENSSLLHAYNVVIEEKDLINANISTSVPKQKIAHSKYSLHSSSNNGLQNLMVNENKLSRNSNNQCSKIQYITKLKPIPNVGPTNPRSVLKTPLRNIIQAKNIISPKAEQNSSLKRTLDSISALTNKKHSKRSKKKQSAASVAIIAISTNKTKNTTEIVINTSHGEQKFKGKTSDLMKATSNIWNKIDNSLLKAKVEVGQPLSVDNAEEVSSSSSSSFGLEGDLEVQQSWMNSGTMKNSADLSVFPNYKYNDRSILVVRSEAAGKSQEPLHRADLGKGNGPSAGVEHIRPTAPVGTIGLTACAKTNQLIAPAETNRPIAHVETNGPTPVQTAEAVKEHTSKRGPNIWPDLSVFPKYKDNDRSILVVRSEAAGKSQEPLHRADLGKGNGPSAGVEHIRPTAPVGTIGLTACAKTNQLIAPAETNRPIAHVETNGPTPVQTAEAVKEHTSKRGPNIWPDLTVFPKYKDNDRSILVVRSEAAGKSQEPLYRADLGKGSGPSASVEHIRPTAPVETIGLTACAKTNRPIAPAETNRPIAHVETNGPTPVQTAEAVKKHTSKRGPNFWPVEQPITEALLELGIDVYKLKFEVDSKGQKLHTCPYKECNKVFSRLSMLKVHILTHYGVRPYKCDYDGCHWTFYTYFKLKRHRETHLKRKLFICPVDNCGRRFTTIYNLNSHQKLHERPAVMICPVETCRACFQTKRSMELHMKKHDSQHAPYKCSFEGCGKHYYSANSLNCHIRSHQHKEEEVRCQWEGCGKLFDKPCRLKAHMRTHTGDKPYPCTYQDCGWAFSSASKLKRHQHKHTNERRFQCSYDGCYKSFMRSEHLKEHALTHVGARTFHCTVENCGVKFSAKSSLYVHLKKHNNGQHRLSEDRSNHCPIQQCKRKCGSKAALRQHMMLVHTHIEASGSSLIDYSPLMTGDEDLVMLDDLQLPSDIVPVTSDLLGTESIAAVLPAPDPQSPSYILHQSDSESSSSVPILEVQLQEDSEDVTHGSARTSYTYQDIVQYRVRKNDETTHPNDSPGLRLPTDVVLGTGILGNAPDITNTLLLQDDQSTYPDDSIVSGVGEFQVLLLDPGGTAQQEFAESTINLRDLE